MYFESFDKIYYNFEVNGKTQTSIVTDIIKNVRIRKSVLSSITLYDEYIIKDGETPEIIAELVYGRPDYHWTILLANNMYDYLNDFPIADRSLPKMILDKYGPEVIVDGVHVSGPLAIHHYETIINGVSFEVSKDPGGITNRDVYSKRNSSYSTTTTNLTGVEAHMGNGTSSTTGSNTVIVGEKSIPITNTDYEYRINEEKRVIKLISPSIIEQMVSEMSKL